MSRRPAPKRGSRGSPRKPATHSRTQSDRAARPDALVVEGRQAVFETLRAEAPVRRVLVAESAKPDASLQRILEAGRRQGVKLQTVPVARLDEISDRGAHQGVAAELAPFEYAPLEALCAPAALPGEPRLVVVADHITDAGNLGAIIRSAEAFGALGVVIPNRRAAQVTAATFKASAGAAAHLPVACVSNVARALQELKAAGFWVAGATEHAETPIWEADLKGAVALVVGNEASGLAELTRKACDMLVKLPLRGKVASLNVAQATAACIYEWVRQNPLSL